MEPSHRRCSSQLRPTRTYTHVDDARHDARSCHEKERQLQVDIHIVYIQVACYYACLSLTVKHVDSEMEKGIRYVTKASSSYKTAVAPGFLQ